VWTSRATTSRRFPREHRGLPDYQLFAPREGRLADLTTVGEPHPDHEDYSSYRFRRRGIMRRFVEIPSFPNAPGGRDVPRVFLASDRTAQCTSAARSRWAPTLALGMRRPAWLACPAAGRWSIPHGRPSIAARRTRALGGWQGRTSAGGTGFAVTSGVAVTRGRAPTTAISSPAFCVARSSRIVDPVSVVPYSDSIRTTPARSYAVRQPSIHARHHHAAATNPPPSLTHDHQTVASYQRARV